MRNPLATTLERKVSRILPITLRSGYDSIITQVVWLSIPVAHKTTRNRGAMLDFAILLLFASM